jgi:protein SCO1/2
MKAPMLFPFVCLGLVGLFGRLAAHGAAVAENGFPENSLYQLPSSWTDDQGRKIRLGDLAGKRRVFTLFFGHCEASCPMAMGRLKTLETKLPKGWSRSAGIVLVTLDPTRDSTRSLADFRRRMSLGTEGWTLLRGDGEDTRELAMLLGVAYRPSEANGGIEHNSVLALVDAQGVVLRKYEGADPGPEFLEEMRKFLASPP